MEILQLATMKLSLVTCKSTSSLLLPLLFHRLRMTALTFAVYGRHGCRKGSRTNLPRETGSSQRQLTSGASVETPLTATLVLSPSRFYSVSLYMYQIYLDCWLLVVATAAASVAAGSIEVISNLCDNYDLH